MNPDRVIAAMFANQLEWLVRNARSSTHDPGERTSWRADDLVIAGSDGIAITATDPTGIDDSIRWLRTTASSDLLVWSAAPNTEADLHLLARGCRDSFRPRWMQRSLAEPLPEPRLDAEVELVMARDQDREALLAAGNVPYVSRNQISRILALSTAPERPRRVWLVLARSRHRRSESKIIGAGVLHLSTFDGEPVGGLYNIGVDPNWQGLGIGTSLTLGLCRIARDNDATRVMLNATPQGERVYRNLDFTVLADGQTWFMPAAVLRDPPTSRTVEAAEAIARGEVSRLESTIARIARLPNGETPIRFASRHGQAGSIRWLLNHGAMPDIAALWSSGLRDEAVVAAGDRFCLNLQQGPEATSPLHEAIRLGDADLVRMLVAAGANLSLRDTQWNGRPIEWARALDRPDLAEIIQRAM